MSLRTVTESVEIQMEGVMAWFLIRRENKGRGIHPHICFSDYPFHAYEDRASAEFDAVMLGAAKPQAYTYRIEEAASTDQLIAKGYTLAKAVPHA